MATKKHQWNKIELQHDKKITIHADGPDSLIKSYRVMLQTKDGDIATFSCTHPESYSEYWQRGSYGLRDARAHAKELTDRDEHAWMPEKGARFVVVRIRETTEVVG